MLGPSLAVGVLKLGLCRVPGRGVRGVEVAGPPRIAVTFTWVRVLGRVLICLLSWRAVATGALAVPGTRRPAAASVSGTGG